MEREISTKGFQGQLEERSYAVHNRWLCTALIHNTRLNGVLK